MVYLVRRLIHIMKTSKARTLIINKAFLYFYTSQKTMIHFLLLTNYYLLQLRVRNGATTALHASDGYIKFYFMRVRAKVLRFCTRAWVRYIYIYIYAVSRAMSTSAHNYAHEYYHIIVNWGTHYYYSTRISLRFNCL